MRDWIKIATDIEVNYHLYDAFLILHGTDTMSFTASALSFMLEELGKTVILTGSQVPLAEVRNDAVENLLGIKTSKHQRLYLLTRNPIISAIIFVIRCFDYSRSFCYSGSFTIFCSKTISWK